MTLLEFYKILLEVDIPIGHYETELEKFPYIIYQELSTSYDYASGIAIAEKINLEVVHFTKKEFCPSLEKLKEVLHKHKIGFNIATAYDHEPKNIINQFEITIKKNLGGRKYEQEE